MQINKTLTALFLCAGIFTTTKAQISELWGTTSSKGAHGAGTIYKTDMNGDNFSLEYSLEKFSAQNPRAGYVEGLDGYLYGSSQLGGVYGSGTIFRMDPVTEVSEVVYNFSGSDGKLPSGAMELVSNGKLVGVTAQGGTNNAGVLYEFDYSTNTVNVLHNFTVSGTVNNSILEASNGLYYGLTLQGGTNNEGTLYSFDPVTTIYTELYSFENATGSFPTGQLIQAANGLLYGLTGQGGTNIYYGVIYAYDIALDQYTVLHNFDDTNGSYPNSTMLEVTNGRLVGTTRQGGMADKGVLFEYDFTTGFNVRYHMQLRHSGELVEVEDNLVWGTAIEAYGNYGRFFSFDFTNSQYYESANFTSAQGLVWSYLYVEDNQYMYALTTNGGITNSATAIKYDYVNDINYKIQDFNYAVNGERINKQLIHAGNHMFYGVCQIGGVDNLGTIFTYDGTTGQYTKLHDFDGANGSDPRGTMLLAADGLLYGTTYTGGANNQGVLFSLDLANNTYTVLHEFVGLTGALPNGELIQATDGKIYGMCNIGGANGVGVIFDYDITTQTYQKRYDFEPNGLQGGYEPYGGLTEGTANMLFGLARFNDQFGTADYGSIFAFNSITGDFENLHTFDQTNGAQPIGNVFFDENGIMYGTALTGGANGNGVFFSFDTLTSGYTNLHDFDFTTTGNGPAGRLSQSLNTKVYGVTQNGTNNNGGALYEYDPQTQVVTVKHAFDGVTGVSPNSAPIEVVICMPSTGIDIQEACDEYIWLDGNTYYASNNTATHTIPSVLGCDSTLTLNLTIKESTTATQTESAIDQYTWPVNNQTYTTSGQYTAVIPNAANCDSTITLDLTMQFTGLEELSSNVSVYPNPTSDNIMIDLGQVTGESHIKVKDVNGKVLIHESYTNVQLIETSLSELVNGIYYIELRHGEMNEVIRVVKQ